MQQGPQMTPKPTGKMMPGLRWSLVSVGMIAMAVIVGWLIYGGAEPSVPDPGPFFFVGEEDNFYENPANWQPSYPGTNIASNQKVVIQEPVYLTGYDLSILGTIQIAIDAEVFSAENGISVLKDGLLINEGSMILHHLDLAGELTNRQTGSIVVKQLKAAEIAKTRNLKGGEMEVSQLLQNLGNFENYGICKVGDTLDQHGSFRNMTGSELYVKGEAVMLED
ncbi:hypothetical protein [Pontibacter sp. G13]|uniref:hypothetical protein n=1 Tax=Pontibacter sp. G13 TaxID=3074898 RepID=UPI00288BE9ED|nr:hypothetical protein [Pontibacter sp. G13]WNJ16776.1 hypothetical protein RJD25_18060 [Pontibacter sp. G13]